MKPRNASIDLLRTILIVYVIIIHICGHGLEIKKMQSATYEVTACTPLLIFLLSATIVAVDVFFMISGYYHSIINTRKILEYVIMASAYSVIMYILSCLLRENPVSPVFIVQKAITGFNSYWFLVVWLIIALFSNYLNKFFEAAGDNDLKRLIALFTGINLLFGFLLDNPSYGSAFSIPAMLYCYMIGYAARRFKWGMGSKLPFGLCYIVCTMFTCIMCRLMLRFDNQPLAYKILTDYRSPIIVLSSLCFFLFFATKIHIKNRRLSKLIYRTGNGTLAAYLITDSADIRGIIFTPVIYLTEKEEAHWIIVLPAIIGYAVMLSIICILVDFIRKQVHITSLKQ